MSIGKKGEPPEMTGAAASGYSAVERLRDGGAVEIRALRPDDRQGLIAAIERTSARSLFRRFFAAKRDFTELEIAYFVNVDFVTHVALIAVVGDADPPDIVGGGRYIVLEPGRAEVAFAVVDEHQGRGIGAALLRHLAAIGRRAGLRELVAEVLPDNEPMLRMLRASALPVAIRHGAGVVHVSLGLA